MPLIFGEGSKGLKRSRYYAFHSMQFNKMFHTIIIF
nr:MAG TPA: hypothetical protein [Bacteriophage sp.]